MAFFLDHDDFAAIGTSLSEHGQVEVSRMTARDRVDQSSLNKGWPARKGTARPSPEDAIGFAEDSGAAVRTMTLHVEGVLALHLRRRAGATHYSGDFALFNDLVLGRLAAAGGRRRELLAGRERKIGEQPARPLTVRLPTILFVNADATGLVLDELARHRGLSVAVMHRNPYLHVVVTDYFDGSNFDVFVRLRTPSTSTPATVRASARLADLRRCSQSGSSRTTSRSASLPSR